MTDDHCAPVVAGTMRHDMRCLRCFTMVAVVPRTRAGQGNSNQETQLRCHGSCHWSREFHEVTERFSKLSVVEGHMAEGSVQQLAFVSGVIWHLYITDSASNSIHSGRSKYQFSTDKRYCRCHYAVVHYLPLSFPWAVTHTPTLVP